MLETILSYHNYIIWITVFIMLVNMILPYIYRKSPDKMIFYSRVGYFFFWAALVILIFSGMMAFMFTGRNSNSLFWLMLIVSVLLGGLEILRSSKSKKLWIIGEHALKISTKIIWIEILLISLTYYVVNSNI